MKSANAAVKVELTLDAVRANEMFAPPGPTAVTVTVFSLQLLNVTDGVATVTTDVSEDVTEKVTSSSLFWRLQPDSPSPPFG